MSFYQGSLLAYQNTSLRSFQANLSLPDSYNFTLGQVGLPRYILNLRNLPAGPARTWAQTPHPFRVIGVSYNPADASAYYTTGILSQWFDILIHIQTTTPAHLLPGF